MGKRMTFAAAGDSFITRRQPGSNKAFTDIASLIRRAEVRFTNLEVTIHDYEGYPSAVSGGTWAIASPNVLQDLADYGFNILSTANNHALDYSHGGLLATLRNLDRKGFVHAGAGRNLAEAGAPRYIDTPSGRTALIAACATLDPSAAAGDQRRDSIGRPGLNPLRMQVTQVVTPEVFAILKQTASDTYLNAYHDLVVREGFYKEPEDGAWLFGTYRFKEGKMPERQTEPVSGDLERLVNAVREAARQADYVLVSIHSHEMDKDDRAYPAEFLIQASRKCIDNGAHAVIGHGPHILRGIEIYRNCPIFYSLGNFIFQSETVTSQPADFYAKYGLGAQHNVADALDVRTDCDTKGLGVNPEVWEAVIPCWKYRDDKLEELVLYPISLGYGLPRYERGWPELSSNIGTLERLAEKSRLFGTEIEIDNRACTGRVRLLSNFSKEVQ